MENKNCPWNVRLNCEACIHEKYREISEGVGLYECNHPLNNLSKQDEDIKNREGK